MYSQKNILTAKGATKLCSLAGKRSAIPSKGKAVAIISVVAITLATGITPAQSEQPFNKTMPLDLLNDGIKMELAASDCVGIFCAFERQHKKFKADMAAKKLQRQQAAANKRAAKLAKKNNRALFGKTILNRTNSANTFALEPATSSNGSSETKTNCGIEVKASSENQIQTDGRRCGSGTVVAAPSIFGIPLPTPANPSAPSTTTPKPGSHVALSGSVVLDATVSVPGGGSLNVGDSLSVGDSVHSSVTTAPSISSGIGAGSGVAGAGSVGNGNGQGNGSGNGNSFNETAGSNAGASSSASGLGGGLGIGGGVGLSGSLD